MCGYCVQIGNRSVACLKLCTERQNRNSSVKIFAPECHEVAVGSEEQRCPPAYGLAPAVLVLPACLPAETALSYHAGC